MSIMDAVKENIKYEEIEVNEKDQKYMNLLTQLERLNSRLTDENERLTEENKRLRIELNSRPVFDVKPIGPNTSTTQPTGYMLPSEFRMKLERDLKQMHEVKK